MTPTNVPFFDGNLRWLDRVHCSADGFVRSARHRFQPPLLAQMGDEIGLTVQAGIGFRTKRQSGRHYHSDSATVGRAFLDRPGERWLLAVEGESRIVQLRLPRNVFDQFLLEDMDEPRGVAAIDVLHGGIDTDLLLLLGKALVSNDWMREVAIRATLARLVTMHGVRPRQLRRRGLSPARLRRVRDLVEADPAGATLEAMAGEAGLSIYHFSREFRWETGQTPWRFVVQRRVWEAIRLLDETDLSVDLVARQAGFAHASHLGKSFRVCLGVSPRTVRGRFFA
jgi:AraC family transcriptional regulator